jgi:hypothetical protein
VKKVLDYLLAQKQTTTSQSTEAIRADDFSYGELNRRQLQRTCLWADYFIGFISKMIK